MKKIRDSRGAKQMQSQYLQSKYFQRDRSVRIALGGEDVFGAFMDEEKKKNKRTTGRSCGVNCAKIKRWVFFGGVF